MLRPEYDDKYSKNPQKFHRYRVKPIDTFTASSLVCALCATQRPQGANGSAKQRQQTPGVGWGEELLLLLVQHRTEQTDRNRTGHGRRGTLCVRPGCVCSRHLTLYFDHSMAVGQLVVRSHLGVHCQEHTRARSLVAEWRMSRGHLPLLSAQRVGVRVRPHTAG